MVKLGRGGRRHPGRQEPVPLFPPGELPVFGPPPVNMRGRGMPPPPRGLPPYVPPPRPMPPPHMRPPLHLGFPPRRPPPPPPLRPLLQTPILPPRPLPFMRGGRVPMPMGGRVPGPVKRLGKNTRKARNKKNKAKEVPKPEGEHYCETCDRGFESIEELETHIAEHVECGLDGCAFVGHPKVVALHVKLQHSTGLYQKISKAYTPEEVNKWRTERKRNFPTRENIEKKKAEVIEKESRGERLQIDKKRFSKNNNDRKPKKRGGQRRNRKKTQLQKYNKGGEMGKNTDTPHLPFPEFLGIGAFIVEEKELNKNVSEAEIFSDDEWKEEKPNETAEGKTLVSSALSAIISCYGTDSEDDGTQTSKQFEEKCVNQCKNRIESNCEELEESDEEPPDEVKISKEEGKIPNVHIREKTDDKNPNEKKGRKRHRHKSMSKKKEIKKPRVSKTIPKRSVTLLEKLLKNEIRQERNFILQCVRFLVQQSFFGIGQNCIKGKQNDTVQEATINQDISCIGNQERNFIFQSIQYIVKRNFFNIERNYTYEGNKEKEFYEHTCCAGL